MADIKLWKRNGSYKDKTSGEEKNVINFFIQCGDSSLIPIEVKFFKSKEDGKDNQYGGRKAVLAAFAEVMKELPKADKEVPDKPKSVLSGADVKNEDLPF